MKKVFMLEDDINAAEIAQLIEDCGYDVEHVDNLYDAIELLEVDKKKYDAIILDATMTGVKFNLPEFSVSGDYNHPQGLNGYLYFERNINTIFAGYEKRLAFFTGYSKQITQLASKAGIKGLGINCEKYMVFDKFEKEIVYLILKWLKKATNGGE
jgi:hypothetical protein